MLGQGRDRGVLGLGRLRDRVLDEGAGDVGEGAEGRCRGRRRAGPGPRRPGATSAAAAERPRTKPAEVGVRPRRGCASPGSRRSTSGRRSPIAAFRATPRPASALPNSVRLTWIAARVGSSKVLKTWSISTGSGVAALSGMVSPGAKPSSESPRWSSRYLRPRADLARTTTVRVDRERVDVLVQLHVDLGVDRAVSSFWTGSTVLTAPTRMPPMRTSLPGTMVLAFGTWAEIL